jgi:hypothetical protein
MNYKETKCVMNYINRLKNYSALAKAPCASLGAGVLAIGGISVEAAGAATTVTAGNATTSWNSEAVFQAAGIDFNVFAFYSNATSASMGLSINSSQRDGIAGQIKFWSGGTQSKVISAGATGAGLTNGGYGGSQLGNFNLLGTGETGSDRYLGFFVQNIDNSDYTAGWINFDFDRTAGIRSFTLNAWDFNVGDSATDISMPASAVPEPGTFGLSLLALGAIGLRRRRATNN